MRLVVDGLRRLRRIPDQVRPASFIFAGPVGCGKRALTLALARALFNEDAIVPFDLAEFKDKIDVEKLLGAPPGYIGHDRESLLSRRLRRDPYTIVTLEHFDAAYDDIRDLFLRGIIEGRINDNQGRTVHLENAVVVIFADLDTESTGSRRAIGFITPHSTSPTYDEEEVLAQVQEMLGQEVIDAVHQVVCFQLLDEAALAELAWQGLDRLAAATGLVVFDADVATWMAKEAINAGTGRRALERLLQTQVAAPVQDALRATPPGIGEVLFVDSADGALSFALMTRPALS